MTIPDSIQVLLTKLLMGMLAVLSASTLYAQAYGSFTDERDGQIYKSVKIGNQIWMAENLNYAMIDSWCYDEASSNCSQYGRLYNWETAIHACPEGWHLPSGAEWDQLTEVLGGKSVAGGKMKAAGPQHWKTLIMSAANESGFTALPGGYRDTNGNFIYLGNEAAWWSATESDFKRGNDAFAWFRYLLDSDTQVYKNIPDKRSGFSVRCIRD